MNGLFIKNKTNWYGSDLSLPNLTYYPRICLETAKPTKILSHKSMSPCQDSNPRNHRIRTKQYDILWATIDQPLRIAAYWFGTNSEGVTKPLYLHSTMQHRQILTYFYNQPYLKYWSQFLTQAPQARVFKIIDKKSDTIKHTLFCLAYISYPRI